MGGFLTTYADAANKVRIKMRLHRKEGPTKWENPLPPTQTPRTKFA